MEILIVGTEDQADECSLKFGASHKVMRTAGISEGLGKVDVVIDFTTPDDPSRLQQYAGVQGPAIFFDTSVTRLTDVLQQMQGLKNSMFGFCGLRTFVNREILEVALLNETDRPRLESVCTGLGTAFRVVADQAGMVTPRVICMIINEAYYTLEEGTATREDIDLAMKLGTNYPWGPFEWGERIGLGNVVRVLEAAGKETGDSRYEVCPLLRESAK